jgi:hypothetical protein
LKQSLEIYGLDKSIRAKIRKQYKLSIQRKLWETTYAATSFREFFAELSSWYFGSRSDCGRLDPPPRAGAEWLKEYDPDAYV